MFVSSACMEARPGVDYIGKLSIKLQLFCPQNVIDYNKLHLILNVID